MEPTKTVRDITWNPLSWFGGINPIYTSEEIEEINRAQRAQSASKGGPRPERVVEPPKERTGRRIRGRSGAALKASPDSKPIFGTLPSNARQVKYYPKGIPTGVGGGNAGQAQSVDPKKPAYIPPTDPPTPTPAPAPAPTLTPKPETVSTFSSPFSVEINFEDFRNPSTYYSPGYKESDFRPGYRENPLTAGSMKGDHKFINPRQKAIMAREELLERSRERKAVEAFSDSIGAKVVFKPDEFTEGANIFEEGFLNNPDNFDYPGLFDPSTRTGI